MTKLLFLLSFLILTSGKPVRISASMNKNFMQHKFTVEEYIDSFKNFAIEEMIRTGVPASIKLGQGILESNFGNSVLAKESNNHFGVKCGRNWNGEKIYKKDDLPKDCFRKYMSPLQSYVDHSNFLVSGDRYNFLFELNPLDYKSWAKGLKKAGYATNPKYAESLIRVIEKYNLNQYSLTGKNKIDSLQKINLEI
jgi:flagellum-specific peptidoglycan hydrolase FlgJ